MLTLTNIAKVFIPLVIIGCTAVSGCASNIARTSASQPLNGFIEPPKDSRQMPTKSELTFPASATILVVPSRDTAFPQSVLREAAEVFKQQLAANKKYIRSVSIVSMDDVAGKVSLGDIRTMYDADIAVVLTYEQDQRSQQSGPGGLIDGTVVGAFLVPSVGTLTSTHVEARVVHITSNALVLRQSGGDKRTTHTTSYGRDAALANESAASLVAATTDAGNSLASTIGKFDAFDFSQAVSLNTVAGSSSTRDTQDTLTASEWNKVDSFKLSGGGSWDWLSLLVATLLFWRSRGNSRSQSHRTLV